MNLSMRWFGLAFAGVASTLAGCSGASLVYGHDIDTMQKVPRTVRLDLSPGDGCGPEPEAGGWAMALARGGYLSMIAGARSSSRGVLAEVALSGSFLRRPSDFGARVTSTIPCPAGGSDSANDYVSAFSYSPQWVQLFEDDSTLGMSSLVARSANRVLWSVPIPGTPRGRELERCRVRAEISIIALRKARRVLVNGILPCWRRTDAGTLEGDDEGSSGE